MSVLMWIYAAIGLLVILTILLAGPYLGLYGTTDPFNESIQGRDENP